MPVPPPMSACLEGHLGTVLLGGEEELGQLVATSTLGSHRTLGKFLQASVSLFVTTTLLYRIKLWIEPQDGQKNLAQVLHSAKSHAERLNSM